MKDNFSNSALIRNSEELTVSRFESIVNSFLPRTFPNPHYSLWFQAQQKKIQNGDDFVPENEEIQKAFSTVFHEKSWEIHKQTVMVISREEILQNLLLSEEDLAGLSYQPIKLESEPHYIAYEKIRSAAFEAPYYPEHIQFHQHKQTFSKYLLRDMRSDEDVGGIAFSTMQLGEKTYGGISELAILPKHQRKGIGGYLLKFAVTLMMTNDPSCLGVCLSSTHEGQPLYRKNGFREIPFKSTYRLFHLPELD
mmetsp:Transcript_39688/g.55270  ORF Transcript_39688/g.55270 Transcript_39688/m.55270 type:complete len:251 (+) Transcript_39688:63-815(+)